MASSKTQEAHDKAVAFLKEKWYSDSQIASWSQKVQSKLDSWASLSSVKSDVKNNTSNYLWLSSKSDSSSWGSSSNINAADVYWDVSWGNKGAWPMDFSNTSWKIDESTLRFWKNAHAEQAKNSSYLTNRNNDIAWYLYSQWMYDEDPNVLQGKVWEYLSKFQDFNDAEDWEQANTKRAIADRLRAKAEEEAANGDNMDWLNKVWSKEWQELAWKAWYYIDWNGNEVKIYWYDEMDEWTRNLLDRLDDSQKKYVSNLWAKGMQEDLKYYLDTMRSKEQAAARQWINQDLYDINRESSIIQAEQTLRNAEESYNNLKQNWQYLGNLGMPWTSATKIQAIWDAISEAKTQLGEVKRLTQLSLDAQAKQWEGQVLQYNQKIDNLMYDLKWKVWDEITGALSKYTIAELEGQLDTIDGITAFRKELLDDLDKNLSWLTSASLTQMQWINQQYQDIADKMYEYNQNANTVNTEMSAVKGFYVDWNGNPILNNMGQPIEIPPTAPMEPIFDKETGKLIQFALDENWRIYAEVQQLWNTNTESPQWTIAQLLQNWYSVADIMAAVPWADADVVTKVAKAMWVQIEWWKVKWLGKSDGSDERTPLGSDWKWNQVKLWEEAVDTGIKNVYWSNVKLAPTVWNMLKQAVDYLKSQWIDLQIWDSYRSYATQKAAYEKDQALPPEKRKWVAAPWKSFHEIWQAIDIAQNQMNDPKVIEALYAAWFTRPVASEAWHWSYWEWQDAFWYATKKETKSYDPSLSRYYENWFKITKDDRASVLKEYWLSQEEFNKQMNNYFDQLEKTEAVESITALRDKAQQLLDWNKEHHGRHNWWMDKATYKEWWWKFWPWAWQTDASEGIAMYNWLKKNQTLDKFLQAKKDWWTFGSMSEWEWKILWESASELNWETNDSYFETQLQDLIDMYNEKLQKIWVNPYEKNNEEWWTNRREKQWWGNL